MTRASYVTCGVLRLAGTAPRVHEMPRTMRSWRTFELNHILPFVYDIIITVSLCIHRLDPSVESPDLGESHHLAIARAAGGIESASIAWHG